MFNKDEFKKIEKYDWETELDFQYRIETGKVIQISGNILAQIGVIANTVNKDFTGCYSQMRRQLKVLSNLKVPQKYEKTQENLLNCVNAYLKAFNFLVAGMKEDDVNNTYKSGRYIKEGNAWMEIAKVRIFEAIEKAVTSYRLKEVKPRKE